MTTPAHKVRLILSLRQGGITDTRILSAIERVPREVFVPEPFRDQAYEDMALPIGHGQTLSQPAVVARMLEALEVGERMKVLEVGTGSGYHAAVMARLCRRVYTIERHRPLLHEAEQRFAALGLHNVTTMAGWDGARITRSATNGCNGFIMPRPSRFMARAWSSRTCSLPRRRVRR